MRRRRYLALCRRSCCAKLYMCFPWWFGDVLMCGLLFWGLLGGCGVELCFLSKVVVRLSVIAIQCIEQMREQHANPIQRVVNGMDHIELRCCSDMNRYTNGSSRRSPVRPRCRRFDDCERQAQHPNSNPMACEYSDLQPEPSCRPVSVQRSELKHTNAWSPPRSGFKLRTDSPAARQAVRTLKLDHKLAPSTV